MVCSREIAAHRVGQLIQPQVHNHHTTPSSLTPNDEDGDIAPCREMVPRLCAWCVVRGEESLHPHASSQACACPTSGLDHFGPRISHKCGLVRLVLSSAEQAASSNSQKVMGQFRE